MSTVYLLVVTAHVLAAMVWLGGMFLFAIVAPILRAIDDDAARALVFDRIGRRFRSVGWACLVLLVLTGVEQLRARGWWGASVWSEARFWRAPLGAALAAKLGLVAFMIVVQALHDFWLGPAAGAAPPGSPAARTLRVRASWLARLNAIAGMALVYFAVRLARGG